MSVITSPRPWRWNKRSPSERSSCRSWVLIAGWLVCSSWLALAMLPSRAVTKK